MVVKQVEQAEWAIDEHTFVMALKSGEESAFNMLVERYSSVLTSKAKKLLFPNKTDQVQDVVQKTFLKVWLKIKTFQGTSSLATWMTRILINCCLELYRREKITPLRCVPEESFILHFATPEPDPEESLRLIQLQEQVRKQLDGLSSRSREIMVLYYFEDLKVKDIAKLLSLNEDTLKVQMHRTRLLLKKRLRNV